MAAPLILARTFREAHAYAQGELGLTIGYYRVVNAPGTIKAVRGRDLHLVPGWESRADRFGMRSAIRYCRNNVIDVAELQAAGTPVDPRGELTERQLEVAYRYNTLLDLPDEVDAEEVADEAIAQVTQDDDTTEDPAPVEPVEKPKARRRSKCKDCGSLHYKDEPCPESESV